MSIWDGIEEFLMVVEAGGFTAAGRRLDVSASHVSRQVARLEQRLGVKLLARSTRSVRLTDAGADYHAKVADLAAGVEEANQSAAGAAADLVGRIRVSAAGPYAERVVAPALARFAKQNPKVSIEIDFDARVVNLIEEGFDFAIRYGRLADNRLIARRLANRPMVCTASPDYIAKHGMPQHPSDLRQHTCVITANDRWTFADPNSGDAIDVRVRGPWRANNWYAVRAAALEGLGVMYSPRLFFEDVLEDGRLVPLLQGYEDPTRSSWLVYPERRHLPLRVRRAMDFLVQEVEL